jgi:hypothetical protein
MAAIAGMRGTGDWGTDERPKNFRETILWRSPNGQAPLLALSARMKSESVNDPEFSWWEEEMNALRLTMANGTAYTSSDTSIVVSSNLQDAQDVIAGDLFMVEKTLTSAYDHEIVMASSVTNTSTVVFKRGQLGTTAAAIAIGANLTKIGNIFEEGSGAPTASTRNPTKLFNYVQIFKTVYEITKTAEKTKTRTGDPVKNDKKRKMFDHSVALEFAAIFGKRYETTGPNGKPMRSSGGLLYMLSQYASDMITVFATTPTETTFTDAVYKVFNYDTGAGDERVVLAGNGALNSLNALAKSQSRTRVHFDGIITQYGMKLQKWVLPQGTLYVKTHPLFNLHARFTNDMMILDPSTFKIREMRSTGFKDDIQDNDSDSKKGQWLSEIGFEFAHLKTSAWISNFVVT